MRDKRPYVKPVIKLELDTGNEKRRWIMAGVLLFIGIAAIAYGFSQALSVQPGWEEVTVRSQETHCGADFKLMYDFSETGGSAASVNKALIDCYSDAAVRAYKLFSPDVEEPGLHNMAYLNDHVNEPVTVDAELYGALSQIAASGNRQLFLAPARVEYNRLFLCENDAEAIQYDPNWNEKTGAYLMALSAFVSDSRQVSLEVLGDNQVKLTVSPDYMAFAEEYGIEVFADFGWMHNAFAADLIAEALTAQGLTNGYLVSFDGFTRNLDDGEFTQNIFARSGRDIYLPTRMHYSAPASLVILRDYPTSDRDRWNYYSYEDGAIVTGFLDSTDCMSKCALPDLVAYSKDAGCAEIALQMSDIFIGDELQEAVLKQKAEEGMYSIWAEGKTLCYNDENLDLELLSDSGPGYTKQHK